MYNKLYQPKKARIAQFMSGSGTNVRKVLEQETELGRLCPYETVVIVTDDRRSKAEEIADLFGKEVEIKDIRNMQEECGLDRKLTLATQAYRDAREEYTKILHNCLAKYHVDFGVFGGFEPLTNITSDFPCINVHPGDLTYEKDGARYLVGLHTLPISRAREEELGYVRSSVIHAMSYTGKGENMDEGPILGLGPKLFYEDETDDSKIQNALKKVSDWKILPAVVLAVACGDIEVDYDDNMCNHPVIMDEEIKISEVE
jgi:folate-dependent phosphoribosylglycinamide formyltransferase PurN